MNIQISESIQNRFSPMIFNGEKIQKEIIQLLIESASLAASSRNEQPWRFIVTEKGSEGYEVLRSLLSDYNQVWSASAPVLILSLARIIDENGKENNYAMYDLGQAISSMAIQASSMGLQIHQMGGFDMEKAREVLSIHNVYLPGTMIAAGYPGDISSLEGHFRKRAEEPRSRYGVDEISGGIDLFLN
jgi:nitroreductase